MSIVVFSQGSTTSAINGRVLDPNGEPVIGATVIAINGETGAKYGNITDVSGFFRIPNMKVGNYEVTISFVGFADFKKSDVILTLGQTFNINASLSESAQELAELVIVANGELIDGNRTGAETNVNARALNSLPNASRTIQDFTRLTPQASLTAGGGISIAGTNNRYNSIFIDGATSNDVFGLASNGQNGGQVSGLSLISIDALEQINVQVAPYDVTLGGFSGGGISAVTRSGTNEFQGSAYFFTRNEGLAGKTPGFIADDIEESTGESFKREKLADFSAQTLGMRLGGPIIKDKLFFFVNAEVQNDETPNPFQFDAYTGGDVTESEINELVSALNDLGYNPGSYENTVAKLEAQKFLAKIDWNISQQHKLTLRHSYNKGENFSPSTSNSTRIRFENSGIFFPTTTNSSALELVSNFGNKSNKLILGYTNVVDNRDPMGSPFPFVNISAQDIAFGSEEFSTGNFLEQKIFTLTDNFNIFKGKHTFTFGTHNEFYDMNNVFIRQNFGSYDYNSIQDFIDDVNGVSTNATDFDRSYSLVDDVTGDDTQAAAAFKAMQLGFYVQDEIQVNEKLKLNAGIRIDIPMFSDDPTDDGYFNDNTAPLLEAAGYDLKGARAGMAPDAQVLFAPRFGFNYDVNADKVTQVRGGLGIFTSRVPFVWPGAMYSNNGATIGGVSQAGVDFVADPFNQPTLGSLGGGADDIPQGQMDLFSSDFKFPQVFRASLGLDRKLNFLGLIATAEAIYTSTINNVFYENLNLQPSTTTFTGADQRATFSGSIDDNYGRIILGSNTNEGYTYNLTVGVSKPYENGWSGSAFYTYGDAHAIFEGTSSQNSSQWRGVYAINGRNNATIGRSDFSVGSRIVANLSYRKEYLNNFATTISLFYNGQSGTPFSYVYNDSFTGEDSRDRMLIYVPATSSDIVLVDTDDATAAQQWEALDAYIRADDYLSTRRGQYAEKNQHRTPFTSIFDLRLLQDIFVDIGENRNTIQISFDIFNFGNFLNKDWGKRYTVPFADETGVDVINYEGMDTDGTTPTFSFNTNASEIEDLLGKDDSGLISSRWQMQLGIRYIFN